jgi:hypothetical protein
MRLTTWIIIFAVAISAYWIGYIQKKQPASIPPTSTTNTSSKASSPALKQLVDDTKAGQPQTPTMTQECSSIFNTLKNMQPLGEGISFSDFGNLLTSYMKVCHPNLNATGGIYGGGINIDLGRVPLQGYGKFTGSTDYTLGCIYNPYDAKASIKAGKSIYSDLIGCQTQTKTFVFDQKNTSGTLNCGVNYTICDFEPDQNSSVEWPPFGKPQKFTSTVDRKHGFNCTPENPSDTQNNNWDCQPY